MTKLSKPKKLTRIDVLIVVFVCLFVCLLILGVVCPAFYHARSKSIRFKCGKNLNDIGKAMLVYANDYDGEFPRAGGRSSVWSTQIPAWMAKNRFVAYGLPADGSQGMATITSCFYLLVKYAGLTPKTFLCPGDKGTTEFKPADDGAGDRELTDLWDFGLEPREHCSYSYHMPYGLYHHGPNLHGYYGQFPLTTSSESGMAIAADPNPWINSPTCKGKDPFLMAGFNPYGDRRETNIGNAIAHQGDGQNVLFMDTHVGFEKRAFCGIDDDNIYTYWDGGDIRRGGLPIPGISVPMDRLDSFLVNDGEGPVLPSPPPIR
jgi:hypothetical protein